MSMDQLIRDAESEKQWGLECLQEAVRSLYRTWNPGETLSFIVEIKSPTEGIGFEIKMKELGRRPL